MFYLIDKPADISSFGVLRKLRKILDIKKIGHSGTLDPFATGCLIIATGKSTKLIPLLESSTKEYIATIRFDGKTESYDTETPIEPVDMSEFIWKSDNQILEFLLSQKTQTPPKYSAIHVDGKRSYELARKGKDFTLMERPIEVLDVEIIEKSTYEITLRMLVSSGCYLRSFGPLLGNFFGCSGGYLSALRRTRILGKNVDISITESSNIENPEPIPINKLFHTIHTCELIDADMYDIINGKKVSVSILPPSANTQDIFFLKNTNIPYTSLCRKNEMEIEILKNDVE